MTAALHDLAAPDSIHEFPVSLEKLISGQLIAECPFEGLEHAVFERAAITRDQKKSYVDVPIRVAMAQAKDLGANLCVDRELLRKLASQCAPQVLSILDLASRKFPLQPVRIGTMALANQHSPVLY